MLKVALCICHTCVRVCVYRYECVLWCVSVVLTHCQSFVLLSLVPRSVNPSVDSSLLWFIKSQ